MLHCQSNFDGFSVLIPFHHRHDLLFSLLELLENIPILIVDDGPKSSIFPPGVRVIRGKQKGFATAVNLGLKNLQNNGISRALILNDDASISVQDIELLLQNYSPGSILSPVISSQGKHIYGVQVSSWGRVCAVFDQSSTIDAVFGTCMMVSTALQFDEGFKHGFEDIELCLRMKKKGYQIQTLHTVFCHHIGGGSMSAAEQQGQRFATYGQLRLFHSIRKAPIISILCLLQVVKEGGAKERYIGVAKGILDWLYNDFPSLAARMASSKAGSSKAK